MRCIVKYIHFALVAFFINSSASPQNMSGDVRKTVVEISTSGDPSTIIKTIICKTSPCISEGILSTDEGSIPVRYVIAIEQNGFVSFKDIVRGGVFHFSIKPIMSTHFVPTDDFQPAQLLRNRELDDPKGLVFYPPTAPISTIWVRVSQ